MRDFIIRNLTFIIVVAITVFLLVGGVFLFSKGGQNTPKAISSDILTPKDAEITGGIIGGAYQPANPSVKVTLVEFGDFQCPACAAYNTMINKLLTDFPGKINFSFRDFAFIGPESIKASEAAYCAGDQNKYWEFHDFLYSHQNGENKGAFSDANLKIFAKDMGLDTNTFNKCFDSEKYKGRVSDSTNSGNIIGLNSTPTFFINGIKMDNPATYDSLKSLVQKVIDNAPVVSAPPSASYHAHFDIKTYINGASVDFTLAKYQESKTNPLDPNIHFHDGNGSVVHMHAQNTPITELFNSFKLTFPVDTQGTSLKVYVNGNLNSQGLSYVPKDLDQILVSFGPVNDANIQNQISAVTNNACIYSLKCISRGTPPPEDCAGGLGSECPD